MSATADDSQKAKKQCILFEPQAWRKTLCRNCFKTKKEHASSSEADEQQKNALSPVVDDGDVVILRREGTPMKDTSRGGTPTTTSTPATSPATPTDTNIVAPEQDTSTPVGKEGSSKTITDASFDKGKNKTSNKASSEVDKNSHLSKASTATGVNKTLTNSEAATAAVGKGELQKTGQGSATEVNCEKSDDGKTSDSKQETDQQPCTTALSHLVENDKDNSSVVDIQGQAAASSAARPVAVDEAVNSSAAAAADEDNTQTSVSPSIPSHQGDETSAAEPSHPNNASATHEMLNSVKQVDIETVTDSSDPSVNTHSVGDASDSTTIARCTDAAAASVTASAASDRSTELSDEVIGDQARYGEASLAEDTKIDRGSGEQSADAAAESMVGKDEATAPGASVCPVRQLDLTPDERTAGIPGGVQSSLFTNDDVVKSVDSSGLIDTTCTSSISHATAVDDTTVGGASVDQQSPRSLNHVSGAVRPEVTSEHAKVEATITLSDSSSPYSRPIHVVSAAGISGYQRGVWTASDAPQNADNFERGRLPPDYDQSAGCSPSSVSDDDYGPTSPLVDYLARSPFARSLHGATERSPETEVVGGRGGETSLFHHVPADSDESVTAAGVGNDTQDWDAEQSRNGCTVRLAANSDIDNRLIRSTLYVLCYHYTVSQKTSHL